MMNQIINYFQQYIGKTIPGPYSHTTWLDGKLLSLTENSMSVEYQVRKEMINPGGFLHGGIQASMMDDIIGTLVNLLSEDYFLVSINMTMDYIGKAGLNDTIIGEAKIIRMGNKIANVEGILKHQNEKLISKSTTNLIKTEIPCFRKTFMQDF